MSEEVTYQDFAEQLNTRFKIRFGEESATLEEEGRGRGETEMELVETVQRESDVSEGFTLLFQGSDDVFLNQQIYAFSHDKLGDFELFIVPVGKDEKGYQYEAVFNRKRN